jgi:hypothetical protein
MTPESVGESTAINTPSASLSATPTPPLHGASESGPSDLDESCQVTTCHTSVTGDENGAMKKTDAKEASRPALDLSQRLFWLSFRNTNWERRFHEWAAGKRVRVCA